MKRSWYSKRKNCWHFECCYISVSIDKAMAQLPHILPDYMLVFAIPILVHSSFYTSHEDVEELTKLRTCLWFILEPLISKNDSYCYGFYKELVDKMKNHKDAVKPEDTTTNCVSNMTQMVLECNPYTCQFLLLLKLLHLLDNPLYPNQIYLPVWELFRFAVVCCACCKKKQKDCS